VFAGISPEDFLHRPRRGSVLEDSMYIKFQKLLATKLYGSTTRLDNVQIVSVMGDKTHTDVRFSAHGSPWYQSSRMDGIVTESRDEVQHLQ